MNNNIIPSYQDCIKITLFQDTLSLNILVNVGHTIKPIKKDMENWTVAFHNIEIQYLEDTQNYFTWSDYELHLS